MQIKYEELCSELVERVPELRERYRQEIAWWGNEEPGPHNIYGDVLVPYLMEELKRARDDDVLRRIFTLLEELVRTKEEKFLEVVQLSVLEALEQEPDCWEKAQNYFGPATRALVDKFMTGEAK